MKKGDVSPVLRSPGGFHIVKLNDLRSRNAPTVVEQTRVRHILVRVNEVTSETEAKAKIERIKDRIDTGAKFADQARLNSEDASSAKGGDLGWVNPGDTVPEFEQAMSKLKIDELSAAGALAVRLASDPGRRAPHAGRVRRSAGATSRAARSARARRTSSSREFMRQVRDKAYVEYKIDEK